MIRWHGRYPGPFLERPSKFSGPKMSCFMLAVLKFRDIVLIVLKLIKWNYQQTRQICLVCELGTALSCMATLEKILILKLVAVPES